MTWFFFVLFSALAVGGGLGVVSSRNVVHSALFLLLALLAVAGLYVLLAAEFLALVQIFIYGGAIIIVLLFAIMLTRSQEYPRISDNPQRPLAVLAALIVFGLLTAAFVIDSPVAASRHRVAFSDLGHSLFTQWAREKCWGIYISTLTKQ